MITALCSDMNSLISASGRRHGRRRTGSRAPAGDRERADDDEDGDGDDRLRHRSSPALAIVAAAAR